MPIPYIEKLVEDGFGTRSKLEKKWAEATKKAEESGKGDNYAYITSIFKKLAKVGPEKRSAAEMVSDLAKKGQLSKSAQAVMGTPGTTQNAASFGMGSNPFLSGSDGTSIQTNMMSGDPGSAAASSVMNNISNQGEATLSNNDREASMGMSANVAVPKKPVPETSPIRSESDIENQIVPDPEATQAAKA